jgi:hypothetical protein
MRRLLKIIGQILGVVGLIYGLPGIAAAIAKLSSIPHVGYVQAGLASLFLIAIIWWNLGKPQIQISGIPWRTRLFFRENRPGDPAINAAFVGFVNQTRGMDEDAIGRGVVGKVTFYTKDWKVAHSTEGVWSEGRNAQGRQADFYPGDKLDLHVAVAVGDRLFAINPTTYRYPADSFINNGPELTENGYMVRVILIGDGVSRAFWFQMLNFARDPNILGLYKSVLLPRFNAWWFFRVVPWAEKKAKLMEDLGSANRK